MRKVAAAKYFYNWDVVHLKFMRNLVEFKDRVLNITGLAAINNF